MKTKITLAIRFNSLESGAYMMNLAGFHVVCKPSSREKEKLLFVKMIVIMSLTTLINITAVRQLLILTTMITLH